MYGLQATVKSPIGAIYDKEYKAVNDLNRGIRHGNLSVFCHDDKMTVRFISTRTYKYPKNKPLIEWVKGRVNAVRKIDGFGPVF